MAFVCIMSIKTAFYQMKPNKGDFNMKKIIMALLGLTAASLCIVGVNNTKGQNNLKDLVKKIKK